MSSMADEKYNAKIKAFAGDRAEWPVFKGKFKSLLVLKGLYDALYESGPEKPFKELLEAEGIVEKEEPDDGDDDDEEEAMLRVLEATGKFKTPGKKEVEDEGEAKQEEAKEVAEQLAKALKTREQQRTAKKEAKEAARRDEDKWRTQNYLIYAHLATNTEGAAYDVVREFEEVMDGSAAYRALVVKYECSGMAQKTDLHSKLVNDTIKGGEDPDRYFRRIEEVQRQLRDVGVPIKNQSMLGFALAKLPPVYSTLGLILEADPKLTYDNFKARIRSYYERKVSVEDEKQQEEDAALITMFKGKCFECGQVGHRKSECPYRKDSKGGQGCGGSGGGQGKKKKIKCHHCGKVGHIKAECWKLKKEQEESASMAIESGICMATLEREQAMMGAEVQNELAVDSACTTHMTNSLEGVTNIKNITGDVVTADGGIMKAIGRGDLKVIMADDEERAVEVTLKDVLIVPKLARKLLSVKRIVHGRGLVQLGDKGGWIRVGGCKFPIQVRGNIYVVKAQIKKASEECHAAMEAELLHRRLGHRNLGDLKKLGGLGVRVRWCKPGGPKCEVCQLAKHTHRSFPKRAGRHRAKEPLELVHTDVLGPIEEPTVGGSRYAILFTDDKTRWRMIYLMKAKSEALECLKRYVLDMKALMQGRQVKALSGLRSDNGGEYTGADFRRWCKEQGILQTFSGPHAPQQDGVAERSWRTVTEMARSMLIESRLGPEMWGEAMSTAVYLSLIHI